MIWGSLFCVVLTAWVNWLTTRKQNHTPHKLSIRNSKLTKPQSFLKSFFFKAFSTVHSEFLTGSWGEDKLHLLVKDWRWEQGQVQCGTWGRFWLESISRSPLPPPTQASTSFKADQVALQTFTVSVDRDSTILQRDLFRGLTKSPVKNFLSIIRISHPAPCDHGLLFLCSATLIVACLYLLWNPSFRRLSSAFPSPLSPFLL